MTAPGDGLIQVRGAELVHDNVVWVNGDPARWDPARRDLAVWERAWRRIRPRPGKPLRIAPGERFLMATRLHWTGQVRELLHMGGMWPVMFIANWLLGVVAVDVWWVSVGLWVGMVCHQIVMCHKVLAWRAQLLVVTSHRLVFTAGIFSSHRETVNLGLYTHISVDQTYPQRVMGYGTVRVESGGQHDDGSNREYLKYVPDPEALERAVNEYVGGR